MERLQHKNIRIVVDATKDLLTRVLPYKPFLIKPNNHELSEIFGRPLSTKEDLVEAAKALQEKGAQHVLISMLVMELSWSQLMALYIRALPLRERS